MRIQLRVLCSKVAETALEDESQNSRWQRLVDVRRHRGYQENPVTPRFPKYAEAETRRESATHIHKENTSRIHAKP